MSKFVPKIDFSKPFEIQLKQLIENHHTTIQNLLSHNDFCKNLANWINSQTPDLQDSFFTWSTKCKWILENMKHFKKCESCGKEIKENISLGGHFHATCSKQCNAKSKNRRLKANQTMLEKYGNENFNNLEKRKNCIKRKLKQNPNYRNEIVEKSKQTKLLRYGNENYVNKEKKKQTNLEKYGVACIFASEQIKNKIAKTNETLYGSKNVFGSKKIKEKIKQTNIEKYGCEFTLQAENIRNQIKQTNLKKYGYENIGNVSSIREKIKATNLKKYGNICPLRNNEIKKISFSKYLFNNICFDSAPELAFYIWLLDNNIKFKYQPNITFNYKHNNKIFSYQPDFLVENQLIELKGNQFLNKDGTWKNPYDKNDNGKTEAKHQCILQHNIKVLFKDDYRKYVEYVETTYGKLYIKSFKIAKQK